MGHGVQGEADVGGFVHELTGENTLHDHLPPHSSLPLGIVQQHRDADGIAPDCSAIQLDAAEEYTKDGFAGNLGEILIRCNNVMYLRGAPSAEGEEDDNMEG